MSANPLRTFFGRLGGHPLALAAALALVVTACGGGAGDSDPAAGDGITDGETTSPQATEAGGTTEDSGGGELDTVRVGLLAIGNGAVIPLGIEQGFFEDEGLELELTYAEGGAAIVPALVSGDLDFGLGNVVSSLVGSVNGVPISIVGGGAVDTEDKFGSNGILAAADSGIEEFADLEGKRVAINTLRNILHLQLNLSAEEAGISPDSFELVEIGFGNMSVALEEGQVDAIMLPEPQTTINAEQGATVVPQPFKEANPGSGIGALVTSNQLLESDPELVDRFVAAYDKAISYAQDNPDEVRRIIPTYTDVSEELAQQIGVPAFGTKEEQRDSWQLYADALLEYGWIEEPVDLDGLVVD